MGKPIRQMPYQPAADLWLDFDLPSPVADYRRELDLDAAIATTRFSAGGVTLTREVFSTAADGVLVVRLAADKPGALSFALSLTSEQPGAVAMKAPGHLRFAGTNRDAEGIAGRLSFAAELRLLSNPALASWRTVHGRPARRDARLDLRRCRARDEKFGAPAAN